MAQVQFIGTGEALDPALPNTSMLLRGARTVLLDCGYAVPHALWAVLDDPDALDALYLSHLHADHAFGLPALCLWMRLQGRRRPLTLLGAPDVLAGARRLLELGYPGSFAPDRCYAIVDAPLPTDGTEAPWGPLQLSLAPTAHKRMANHAVAIRDGDVRFGYSGDGAPTAASLGLLGGLDLVVHECFGLRAHDTPAGHAAFESLVPAHAARGTGRLALVHFARDRAEALRSRVDAHRDPGMHLIAPRPGDTLTVGR